ncbi:MAG: RNA polymerase sigma factor [Roseburia sp.]|nr:RNA polymerase sigma factor [Roseburia sp.]
MTKQELEQCIHEYGKDIYSFCKHLTCNQQEADDLYQDTFLKAMELQQKIDRGENPKSYLLSIAVRIWKNRKRKYAWRNRIAPTEALIEERDESVIAGAEASPEETFIADEKAGIVRRVVEKLPKKLKVCVLLFYMEELSVTQIASVLKVPEGTVKSRLYQARKRLEKELENVL